MAWIKIDHATGSKPEVFMIAQKMSITRAEALGHLIAIWIWFDQVSEDGTIRGNKAMIDSLSREGFAEALEEIAPGVCDWRKICSRERSKPSKYVDYVQQ